MNLFRNICLSALGLVGGAPAALAQQPPQAATAWQFTAGLGAVQQPLYPGSGEKDVRAIPLLGAGYGRYFIGAVPGAGIPAGIGAFVVQEEKLRVGLGLGGNFRKPRKASDAARLQGLGDIDATVLGAAFASYHEEHWALRGTVVTDLGGKRHGTQITLDLDGKLRLSEQLVVTAGPGLGWGDNKYTQTFFGIDADQSARSGRPAYSAKSGVHSLRFAVAADYRITPQWGLGAKYSAVQLRGDAANSPITEKKSQNTFAVFSTYRF